jgi:hypothetical protein
VRWFEHAAKDRQEEVLAIRTTDQVDSMMASTFNVEDAHKHSQFRTRHDSRADTRPTSALRSIAEMLVLQNSLLVTTLAFRQQPQMGRVIQESCKRERFRRMNVSYWTANKPALTILYEV